MQVQSRKGNCGFERAVAGLMAQGRSLSLFLHAPLLLSHSQSGGQIWTKASLLAECHPLSPSPNRLQQNGYVLFTFLLKGSGIFTPVLLCYMAEHIRQIHFVL
uniref:Uncharacterized protein n=1 Tax=Sphaerodactylus townsendi TaxID=933632 RepID=A0ACB8FFN6_9SAUR